MAHWLRLIFSVLALVGLLAAGTGGAYAAKAQHHCCPEMATSMPMENQAPAEHVHHGVAPDCCLMSLCAVWAPAAPAFRVSAAEAVSIALVLPANDDGLPSRSIAPDLPPPIA